MNTVSQSPVSEPASSAGGGRNRWFQRYGWLLAITLGYFILLTGTLVYKRERLMSNWSIDEAYMIQQFHNWWSGYPKVTVQPGDLRSGYPGERPFEENHKKRIYIIYKLIYRLWPKPESLIVVYALFVSLSIPALYLFLKELQLSQGTMLALLAAWLAYPLQQKVAFYSYCDPLSYCGTFYFIYLFLLRRNSPFAVLGCLGMFLLREETFFLVPATVFLLPQKWKTLLWHFACMVPLVLFARHGVSNPLAYASVSFNPAFVTNFILTQTILWVLALVNAPALFVAAGFLVAVICVGGEIFFQFPQAFVGASFSSPGPYYYYGLLTPILLAAVALGMARLNANQKRLAQVCLALLIVPGIAYAACQLRILGQPDEEARQIRAFAAASVPPDAAVVTDLGLPAYFANRNELYVYRDPPKGVTLPEIFARAKFAFIFRPDLPKIKAVFLDASPQHWRLAMELPDYAIYRAD